MARFKERALSLKDDVHASFVARKYPQLWRSSIKQLELNHSRNLRDARNTDEKAQAEKFKYGGLMLIALDMSFFRTGSLVESAMEIGLASEYFQSRFNQTGNEYYRDIGFFLGRTSMLALELSMRLNQIHDSSG